MEVTDMNGGGADFFLDDNSNSTRTTFSIETMSESALQLTDFN